jgi:hypothetical protein
MHSGAANGSRQVLGANPAMRRAWLEYNTGQSLEAAAETAFAPEETHGCIEYFVGAAQVPRLVVAGTAEALELARWLTDHADELAGRPRKPPRTAGWSTFVHTSLGAGCLRSSCSPPAMRWGST